MRLPPRTDRGSALSSGQHEAPRPRKNDTAPAPTSTRATQSGARPNRLKPIAITRKYAASSAILPLVGWTTTDTTRSPAPVTARNTKTYTVYAAWGGR
jgi:hypothetical protein